MRVWERRSELWRTGNVDDESAESAWDGIGEGIDGLGAVSMIWPFLALTESMSVVESPSTSTVERSACCLKKALEAW